MRFEELKKGTCLKHKLREEWGIGTVEMVFPDRSVIIYFPDKPKSHPDGINKFRYYEPGFKEFIIV